MPVPALSRRARILLVLIAVVIVALIALGSLTSLYVDWRWFGTVDHGGEVFSTVFGTRALLFVIVGVLMAVIFGVNLVVAYRSRPTFHPMSAEQASLERYRSAIEPKRRPLLVLVVALVFLLAGISGQGRWQTWLQFWNRTSFGVTDPQFGKDISFYAFTYPFERMILGYLFVVVFLSLLGAIGLHYLFGGLRIQGPGEKVTRAARAHLSVLLGVFVLLKVLAYYLDRYGLLFSNRGGITGASYADVNATLPAKAILFFVALICAIAFIANVVFRNFALPAIALVLLVLSSVLIGGAYPAIVQQFSVRPNANEKERPYIARNITATRAAYDIVTNKNVAYKDYNATTSTGAAVQKRLTQDTGTIPNARLLDPNVLAQTFDQLQRIKNYYGFDSKLDIDRYRVNGLLQDYVVGVRELDPSKLTGNQTNWINEHLVYTHGNGFVAAPANRATPGGAPNFTTYDLPTRSSVPSMQPKQGRIYFGELFGADYAIVGKSATQQNVEYDRPGPSGTDIKSSYTGSGGVKLGGLINRLAFAIKYRERNILLSSRIGSDSKILFVRDPRDRVQKLAPFLKVDGDPYPAVINGRIEWIVDGYTTSDGYPYAERQTLGELTKDSLTGRGTAGQPQQQFNYIRNSVKATVDAYSGKVTLYQFDPADPVLKTWMKVFPNLVQPQSSIPTQLRDHFRYPEDLFKVQRDLIASYHVNDPQQFFNSQNFWQVPGDPTAKGGQPQPPYYLVAQGPDQKTPTFQLTSTLTPLSRTNMAAYVSVSGDPATYGQIKVLQLPGDSSVPGPQQAQSQFNSNTNIAQSVRLLQGGNSEVIFGNLLTLPVAGGLLYVEPLYVQGTRGINGYPLLRKVLVLFGTSVGFNDTLPAALADVFTPGADAGGGSAAGGSSGGGNGTSSPPPTSQPPSSVPSSPGSGGSVSVTTAVADIRAALTHLKTAQQQGDFAGIGEAQAELSRAIAAFEQAGGGSTPTGSAPTTSPTSAPTRTPTRTPTPSGTPTR
ncbi:MAG: UPF0182 family membrane protein [Mycobacteriales bacterium]